MRAACCSAALHHAGTRVGLGVLRLHAKNCRAARRFCPGDQASGLCSSSARVEQTAAERERLLNTSGQETHAAERSPLVREARRACVQRRSLVDIYQAAEKVQDHLARGAVTARDAATLLSLFAKKKFAHKPFWRSAGRSFRPLLPDLDAKGMALVLNAFANAGVVNRTLFKEASHLIISGSTDALTKTSHKPACDRHAVAGGAVDPVVAERGTACQSNSAHGDVGDATLFAAGVERPQGEVAPQGGTATDTQDLSPSGDETAAVAAKATASVGLQGLPQPARCHEGVEAFLVPSALNPRLKRGEMSVARCAHDREHAATALAQQGEALCNLASRTSTTAAKSNAPCRRELEGLSVDRDPHSPGHPSTLGDKQRGPSSSRVDSEKSPERGLSRPAAETPPREAEPDSEQAAEKCLRTDSRDSESLDTLASIFAPVPCEQPKRPDEPPSCPQTQCGEDEWQTFAASGGTAEEIADSSVSKGMGRDPSTSIPGKETGRVRHMGSRGGALVDEMNAHDVALVANAFAKLGVRDAELYSTLAARLPAIVSMATSLQLVTLFAAYSKAGVHDFSVFHAISRELLHGETRLAAGEGEHAYVPPKIRELDANAVAILLNHMQKANFIEPSLASALLNHLERSPSLLRMKKRACQGRGNAPVGVRGVEEAGFERLPYASGGTCSPPLEEIPPSVISDRRATRSFGKEASCPAHKGTHESGELQEVLLYEDLGPRELSLTLNALSRLPHPQSLREALVTFASNVLSSMNDTDVLITTKALLRLQSKLCHSDAETLFLQIRSRFRTHSCGVIELAALASGLQRLVVLAPHLRNPAKHLVQEIAPHLSNRLYKLDNRTLVQLASAVVALEAYEENLFQELLVEVSRRLPDLSLEEKLKALHVVHVLARGGSTVAEEVVPFLVCSILEKTEKLRDEGLPALNAAGAKTLVVAASELRVLGGPLKERLLLQVAQVVPHMSGGQKLAVAMALLADSSPTGGATSECSVWTALISGLTSLQERAVPQEVPGEIGILQVPRSCAPESPPGLHDFAGNLTHFPRDCGSHDDRGASADEEREEGKRLGTRIQSLTSGGGALVASEKAAWAQFQKSLCKVLIGWSLLVARACHIAPFYGSEQLSLDDRSGVVENTPLTDDSVVAAARTSERVSRFLKSEQTRLDTLLNASRCDEFWKIRLSSPLTESLLKSFKSHVPLLARSAADQPTPDMGGHETLAGEIQGTLLTVASEAWQATLTDFILREGRALKQKTHVDALERLIPLRVSAEQTEGEALRRLVALELERISTRSYYTRFLSARETTSVSSAVRPAASSACYVVGQTKGHPAVYLFPVVGPFVVTAIVDFPEGFKQAFGTATAQ
ncbi:hypothetical protein BESB_083610 [Besnoitia besnoiti]|uniref:RAP domain-containing protein n=1 Tax=Besnoitia besnoiti TaxID=94643 RepID=A0A2A9MCR0_BESBE|nr:hypothetical protein BESB_083610 [Besnoitia besnoiti]PFH33162.1 hypothetical protein BESB_083610 [Besnoitia besnoiti]